MKFGRSARLLEPVQRTRLGFLRKATSRWMPRLRGGRQDKYSTLVDDGCDETEIVFDDTAELTETTPSKSFQVTPTELFSPSCWNELVVGDSFDKEGLSLHQTRSSSTSKISGITASTVCSSDDGDISTMEGSTSGDDECNVTYILDEDDDCSSIVLSRSSPSRRSIVRFADEVEGMGELEKVYEFACWCVEQPDSWIPLHHAHGTVEHR